MIFLRWLLVITILYTIPYGLVFLLAPEWGLGLFNLKTNSTGLLIARYFAAMALGVGVLAVGVRLELNKSLLPRVSMYACMFVAFGITLMISAYALAKGQLPTWIGWIVVGFDIFFTVGYGYFLFVGDPVLEEASTS